MPRSLFPLAALLLCSTALAGCETMSSVNPFAGNRTASDKAKIEQQVAVAPPTDIASGVRQAHDLRLAGQYDQATRILSQLMLVASDDPRVVGEYGKTLLQRGQAQDAVLFLSRTVQIQSGDWTNYSALGVAYDQLGDQASAKSAYEHALAIDPREASVLSNYALSRMLAKDVAGARALAARAESAGGSADPKIARNIAMIEALAPQEPVAMAPGSSKPGPTASATPAPLTVPQQTASAPVAPRPAMTASAAPHVLLPEAAVASKSLPPGMQPLSSMVMQIAAKPVSHSLQAVANVEKPAASGAVVSVPVRAESVAPVLPVKSVAADKAPAPMKTAAEKQSGVPALRMAAGASAP